MKYVNPKSTVGCILIKDNKVLLVQRLKNPFKGFWCLPGGHAELFEKLENAVKREIREELGIKIKPKFFTVDQEIYKNLEWHANVFFFISKVNGKIKLDKNENSGFIFCSKKEIKKIKMAFNHKKILNKFFKNEKY